MHGPLVPSAPPRTGEKSSGSCSGRRSKYAPGASTASPSSKFAKTCPSGFGAAIAAERAAAQQRGVPYGPLKGAFNAEWDDDKCGGSSDQIDSMASTATSMSEFPSRRMMTPQKLRKGMMELANRFCPSATSIPRTLSLSMRPASSSSAMARLQWQPQVPSWSGNVPRNSGMLARLEKLRQQAMQIHREIQKNKFSIQMVRESYTKIGQSVPALPPLDGEATLPHPSDVREEQNDTRKGPTVNIDIEINLTQENACGILGVEQDASNDDVKKAYRSLAKFAHPDKGGARGEFQRLGEAYTFLQNK